MKKIPLLILMICITASLFAVDADELSRRFNKEKNDTVVMLPLDDLFIPIKAKKNPVDDTSCVTLFFPGVNNSIDYNEIAAFNDPNHTANPALSSISTTDTDMEEILKIMIENAPDCKQILIGHSQGGVRALAYANVMNKLGYGDRILAVITIGAPVIGHPALTEGQAFMEAKLNEHVNILRGGISSIDSIDDGWEFNLLRFFGIPIDLNGLMNHVRVYLNNAVGEDSMLVKLTRGKGVAGLNPRSQFMKDYLGVEYQNGTYTISPIISPDTYVGFIVGENNNLTDLIPNADDRELAKEVLGSIREIFQEIVLHHNGEKELAEMMPFGLGRDRARHHEKACEQAKKVRNWFDNYENHISDLYYGTDSYFRDKGAAENYGHDCFIPTAVQYRQLSETGGKEIMPGQYIFRVPDAIHEGPNTSVSETHNKHIWGAGKGFDKAIGTIDPAYDSIIPGIFNYHIENAASEKEKNQWKQAQSNFYLF